MNADELDAKIAWEGGIAGALECIRLGDIEDDQLRQAWQYLTEEWQRFEVHILAFEAILEGKLSSGAN